MKDEDRTKSQLLDELRKMRQRVAEFEDLERERASAEKRLRLLSSAVEQSSEGIALSDLEGNLLFVNNAFAAMHGYTPGELLGQHLSVFHAAEQMKSVEAANRHIKETGSFSGEVWHVKRDGTLFPTLMHNSPLRNEAGEPIGMIGTLRDITDLKKTEEDLRAAKDELHQLVSLNPAIIYRSAISGDFGATFISENTFPLLGYSPKEFVEKSSFWADHIHPEDRPRILAGLPQVLEKGHHVHEYRFQHRDGSYRWMHDELKLVRDADGNPQEIIGYCLVITDRKRAETALRKSEARYRAIVKDQTELICRFLPDTTLTFVNEAYCRYFGKDPQELIGKSFMPFIPDEDRERVRSHFAFLSRDNPVATHEHRVVSPDGEVCWQQWTNRAIFDQEGRLIEFQSVGRDITARKRAEKALRKSEMQYRTTIDSMGDLIHVVDTDLRFILFNAAFKKRFKELNLETDAIGRTVFEVFTFLPRRVRDEYLQVLQSGETLITEESTTIGSREFITETRKIPVLEDDSVVGVVTVIRDITERKRAEEALRRSEEKYRRLFESTREGIVVSDEEGRIKSANPAAAANLGYGDPQELVGVPGLNFYADPKQREALFRELAKEGYVENYELTFVKKDGTPVYLLGSATAIRDGQGNVLRTEGIFSDITERRQAQEALAAEKERLAVTLHSIGDAVIATDIEGKVVLLNRVAEKLTGCPPREAGGHFLSELFHVVHEKTGQPREDPVKDVLETNESIEVSRDALLIGRDGTEQIIAYNASPMRDAAGNTIGVVLAFRDITERRRMEEELFYARSMEAIGLLAGGIAHDFGNTLTTAVGNLFLARKRAEGNREVLEKLRGAEKAIFRARHLTDQLLTFSQGGAPVKKAASISELLRETMSFALSGSNVLAEFHIPEDLWTAEVDVGQISQVINNLAINAVQAMPDGGKVIVSAENVRPRKEPTLPLKQGKYVRITVRDEGVGIPKENSAKVFLPYFTTKPKGSGLGLATAYSIIDKHSGHITFESEPGVGSTFVIYLPASRKKVAEKKPAVEEPIRGKGRILLMDDEQDVRDTMGEALRGLGYEVDVAGEGEEAVDRYLDARESGRPYDGVILDLTVQGGMGGKETIKKLVTIDPKVKALVSSGYSHDPVTAEHKAYGFSGVVSKPYRVEELSRALHEMLGETGQ